MSSIIHKICQHCAYECQYTEDDCPYFQEELRMIINDLWLYHNTKIFEQKKDEMISLFGFGPQRQEYFYESLMFIVKNFRANGETVLLDDEFMDKFHHGVLGHISNLAAKVYLQEEEIKKWKHENGNRQNRVNELESELKLLKDDYEVIRGRPHDLYAELKCESCKNELTPININQCEVCKDNFCDDCIVDDEDEDICDNCLKDRIDTFDEGEEESVCENCCCTLEKDSYYECDKCEKTFCKDCTEDCMEIKDNRHLCNDCSEVDFKKVFDDEEEK